MILRRRTRPAPSAADSLDHNVAHSRPTAATPTANAHTSQVLEAHELATFLTERDRSACSRRCT